MIVVREMARRDDHLRFGAAVTTSKGMLSKEFLVDLGDPARHDETVVLIIDKTIQALQEFKKQMAFNKGRP